MSSLNSQVSDIYVVVIAYSLVNIWELTVVQRIQIELLPPP